MLSSIDRANVERDIAHLTENDKPDRKASFAAGIWRNVRNWEEWRRLDPKAFEWALLDAYLARVDCDDDLAGVFHAERMAFVQRVLDRLVARDGLTYAWAEPHRLTLLRRFYPHDAHPDALPLRS